MDNIEIIGISLFVFAVALMIGGGYYIKHYKFDKHQHNK